MSDETLCFDLVLVRGPESLHRRVTVLVPLDGSPVTVGRAPHCHVVLDPRLVFTSQVHCNLYCVCPSTHTAHTPAKPSLNSPHTPDARPAPRPRVFISDLCSSNGTFVNARRVGGTDPVELKDGDALIFGGMRDVEVGECIPDDAFAGPELVVWRVDGLAAADTDTPRRGAETDVARTSPYAFEATPMLLPTQAALDEAERALLQTALQSLRKGPPAARLDARFTPTPSARTKGGAAPDTCESGRPSFSPADVPQALFVGVTGEASPPPPPATAAKPVRCVPPSCEPEESEPRRSGTVAARLSHCATTTDDEALTVLDLFDVPASAAEAVATVHFHAARVGRHRFHVADPALLGTCATRLAEAPAPAAVEPAKVSPTRAVGAKHARTASPVKAKGKKGRKTTETEVATTAAPVEGDAVPPVLTPDRLCEAAPFCLAFTPTHWKWTMDMPRVPTAASTAVQPDKEETLASPTGALFHALLPITSVESVLVCAERAGVAVELKEGRQLPLVDAAVMAGGPENRWLVFLLEARQMAATRHAPAVAAKNQKATQKRASTPVREEEAVTMVDLDFQSWVASLAAFYSAQKFPQPLYVEADDFDLIYAPPTA